jgi:hypothetical protein
VNSWHAATLILGLLVAGLAALLVSVMRQVGNLMIMINPTDPRAIAGGPEVGAQASEYDGPAPAVLVFVSPDCAPCTDLAPTFSVFRANWADVALVPIVSNAGDEARAEYARKLGTGARYDLPHLYPNWNIPGTPYAVAVDASHHVRRTGVTNTLDQLETLAATALSPPSDQITHRETEEVLA